MDYDYSRGASPSSGAESPPTGGSGYSLQVLVPLRSTVGFPLLSFARAAIALPFCHHPIALYCYCPFFQGVWSIIEGESISARCLSKVAQSG